MPLRQLTEQEVYDICQRAAGAQPDWHYVDMVVSQSGLAVSASSVGDPIRTYAAAVVMQTILYSPVPGARLPYAAWACGLAALDLNGLDPRAGFDASGHLRAMITDKMHGRLTLARAVDLIDDALA